MDQITLKQRQVFEFIKYNINSKGMPPTIREIAKHMGFKSDNSAYQHLNALERKGILRKEGCSRGITLLVPTGIPVIGRVAAGLPLLADQNISEYLNISPDMFQPYADYFLKVDGTSMKEIGINNGDLLAVHKISTAQNHQIIVARIDDEVTVKRYHQNQNIVTLLPENPEFSPIKINLLKDKFDVEGIAVGLFRKI